MADFKCRLGTEDKNIIEQVFEANSQSELLARLKEEGYFVFKVKRLCRPFRFLTASVSSWRTRDFMVFNQQLMIMLRSGASLNVALETIVEQEEKGSLKDIFKCLLKSVQEGNSFSEALEKFPEFFPPLYIFSLRAGEGTGKLCESIGEYVGYLKKIKEAKKKIFSAAFYPMFLVGIILLVMLFLFTYVVPKFSQIYASADAELPWATELLISVTSFLAGNVIAILTVFILMVAGLYYYNKSNSGHRRIDSLKIKLPFIGNLLCYYLLSIFCRSLSTLLAAGIPLVSSLKMSLGVFTNTILRERMALAVKKVEEGSKFTDAVSATHIFPLLALRMIRIGESTGSLSLILNEIAEYYEGEIDVRLQILSTLIEPVLMIIMGIMVGGIIIAMYLPIFYLAGTV